MEQTILTMAIGLISILLTIVGFFGVRTLKKIDANQTVLFDRVSELSKDFYTLKGSHDALIMKGVRHE
jgi:hypothetical protein